MPQLTQGATREPTIPATKPKKAETIASTAEFPEFQINNISKIDSVQINNLFQCSDNE